jgi:hypothetical protein
MQSSEPSDNVCYFQFFLSVDTLHTLLPATNPLFDFGDAARLADVDRWTMRDLPREYGVELRLGLVDEDDAAYEVKAARQLEFDDEHSDDVESPVKRLVTELRRIRPS